ncbi:MAG: polymer-forming cytoskeletal protein [Candidatus Kerfeldbacteria bacterium]|nr:polymer-forming cytoskeletal protein [Candidatus Kerfeldbacteria bacterium]
MAMFNREEDGSRAAETVIGSSVKVEGNFVGSGNVVVEGVVNGTLKTAKDLRVGDAAKIKADVEAANVVVAGEIHGNVKTSGRLEVAASGKVIGNVEAAVLVVMEGAIINGKVVMMKAGESAPVAPLPEKKRTA